MSDDRSNEKPAVAEPISAADLNAFRVGDDNAAGDPGPSPVAVHVDKKSVAWVPGALKRERKERAKFKRSVEAVWQAPLDRLESIASLNSYAGRILNERLRADEQYRQSERVEALTRVHSRCIQICWEINCLLAHGFADGAMGRWRS